MLILSPGGAPRLSVSPASPYMARRGQRVQLECVVEGSPAPSVSWSRVDGGFAAVPRPDASGRGSAVLVLESVTSHDQGTYVCTAVSAGGATAETRFELSG